MSKKILFLFLFIIFIIIAYPQKALATTFDPVTSPDPIYTNNENASIIVTASDPYFNSGSNYAFKVEPLTGGTCIISYDYNHGDPFRTSPDVQLSVSADHLTITASWQLQGSPLPTGCRAVSRDYKFNLWVNGGPKIVVDYTFTIQQTQGGTVRISPFKPLYSLGEAAVVVIENAKKFDPNNASNTSYEFWWEGDQFSWATDHPQHFDSDGTKNVTLNSTSIGNFNIPGQKKLCMKIGDGDHWPASMSCDFSALFRYSDRVVPPTDSCDINPSSPTTSGDVNIKVSLTTYKNVELSAYLNTTANKTATKITDALGITILNLGHNMNKGHYTAIVNVSDTNNPDNGREACRKDFDVSDHPPDGGFGGGCTGTDCTTAGGDFCDPGRTQLKTTIGCLPIDGREMIPGFLKLLIGISGGVALLLMIAGAIQMITSAGNPETLKAGHERFIAATIGLLFIILSVTILEIIGVDILSLPGFGR